MCMVFQFFHSSGFQNVFVFLMAGLQDVFVFFLPLLLPRSSLYGLAIAVLFLVVLVPLRIFCYQTCRVPTRHTSTLRMTKAEKRRAHQKALRSAWIKDRRQRQGFQRILWKLCRQLSMSTNVAGAVDSFASNSDIDAMDKASAPHKLHQNIRGHRYQMHLVFARFQTSQVPMTH